MSNEITNTQASAFIKELWRPGFLKALSYKAKIKERVLKADGDVQKKGDILHIKVAPEGSVNPVGIDGSVTNQALTPTDAQLVVDKWYEYTVDIVDKAGIQAEEDLKAALFDSAPGAFAKQIDSDLAALYSDLTVNTAIDATSGLDDNLLLDAFVALLNQEIPMEDPNNISWIFRTNLYKTLKNIAQISEAQITGSKGGLIEYKIPDVMGIPVFFSTAIASAESEYKNLLIHRDTFACGVQKNFNIEQLARVKKSTPYSADMLYGVKTVRAKSGIVIRTADGIPEELPEE